MAKPKPASALLTRASDLIRAGQLADARAAVDAAAAFYRKTGNTQLHAACLHMAAVLSRLVGDLDGAEVRARRANAASGPAARLRRGGADPAPRQAAQEAVASAREQAIAGDDHAALAQLAMLDVALAIDAGDIPAALRAAETARAEALEGVAPREYLAAAVAIAELADRQGDRDRAYETMAVALVTLADVVGMETARTLAEPELFELRRRWGAEAFADVKVAYEARRRALTNRVDDESVSKPERAG